MKRLIFIHGINNQNNSVEKILEEWQAALKLGAPGLDLTADITVSAAFYGKMLADETDDWDPTDRETLQPMGADAPDSDYAPDEIAALYKEFQRAYDIPDSTVVEYLDEEDEITSLQRMGKGIHKKWLKAIARALEKVVPGLADDLADRFLKQASAYLFKPGLKDKIETEVFNDVFQQVSDDDELIIVSHSLGTIVSYELLRRKLQSKTVPLFLTAGSPLAIKLVKERIGGPYLKPVGVTDWMNVSDKEDFVALHPKLDAETFGPAQIDNLATVDNGNEDPHDIRKYLAHTAVAERIAAALAS